MKKQILFIGFFVISLGIFAQVGINTTAPDSSAVLDLNSNNKGLLIPTMTTIQREAMTTSPPATGLANGLLVFDTDMYQFFFYDSAVNKWISVNPWRKEYTDVIGDAEHVTTELNTASSVGINQTSPNSKLTVNGNLSVGNTNTTAPANGAYIDGQVRIGSGAGNTEQLEVGGNTTVTGTTTANEFVGKGITPVGGIIMYSGGTAGLFDGSGLGVTTTKMKGWAICNGNNGTPDLRGRFVVGATMGEAVNDGDYVYAVTEIAGENTHQLTIAEMPSHNHTMQPAGNHNHEINGKYASGVNSGGAGDGNGVLRNDDGDCCYYENTDSNGSHTHVIDNEGGDGSHENRPPFYAVYYIMRIN